MYSPCVTCKSRFNREYSKECDVACEYAMYVMVLRDTKDKLERLSEMSLDDSIEKIYYGLKEIISDLAEL